MGIENLELISFEVCNYCNLSHIHPWCPSNREDRYQDRIGDAPMTVDGMDGFMKAAVNEGFKGRIAFHYYNEPTLDLVKCASLAGRAAALGLKTCLWTNGTDNQIPDGIFDDVFTTQYDVMPDGCTRKMPYVPDDRINIYDHEYAKDYHACYKPSHIEMPITYYGDVRLCCGDWKGTYRIGNIMRNDYHSIFVALEIACGLAELGTLDVCKRCHGLKRTPAIWDKEFRLWR